jgi:sortase A
MPDTSDDTRPTQPDKIIAADDDPEDSDAAVALIRSKISALYGDEPDATEEAAEIAALPPQQLSRHQLYMQQLTESGRTPAEVQAAWHEYYTQLSDAEKHDVWREFYDQHNPPTEPTQTAHEQPEPTPVSITTGPSVIKPDRKNLRLQPIQEDEENDTDDIPSVGYGHSRKPSLIVPTDATQDSSQDDAASAPAELPKLAAAAEALGGALHEEADDSTDDIALPGLGAHRSSSRESTAPASPQAQVLPPAQANLIDETPSNDRTPDEIRENLLTTVSKRAKTTSNSNLKSLMFGLGMGGLVLLITTFSFFNERFIAPLITPSRVLSSTPLILDDSVAVGDESRIIIPKINVEVPLVFDAPSIEEDVIQEALEDGITHYPTTPMPGETGNSVLFGHSSNNILNRGQYKFAFVLLNRLENGDTFMIEHEGVRYTYRVFESRIVPPTEISVLDPHPEKDSVVSLITCDPPGTAINRLVVIGEQISPDPSDNTEGSAPPPSAAPQPDILPSNAPSLWQRLFGG